MKRNRVCGLQRMVISLRLGLLVVLLCSIVASGCTGPGKATAENLRPVVLKMLQETMADGTADKLKIEVVAQEGVFAKTYIDDGNVKELVYFHCASGEWQMISIVGKMTPDICKRLKIPKSLWP